MTFEISTYGWGCVSNVLALDGLAHSQPCSLIYGILTGLFENDAAVVTH